MQCLHPLAGRAIQRDDSSGLLFVRCGECGAASALFEYPTIAPWMRRIKTVAASTLVVVLLLTSIALAAVAGGLTAAATGMATEASVLALTGRYNQTPQAQGETPGSEQGWWFAADEKWLGTEEGAAALAASRWAAEALVPLASLTGVGMVLTVPFAAVLGIALMRHGAARRALVVLAPCLIGIAIGAAGVSLDVSNPRSPNWLAVVAAAHGMTYAMVAGACICATGALVAIAGPGIAALVARVVLPPRDRRLVGWLWEWRGKPIPR